MSSNMDSPPRILPLEVICHIISFLGPRDVTRLRAVSKQFHDLSCDPAIWRTLYANACLPRPPGPFPSQSVQFLERKLVQSERLAHSWTSQPMGDISISIVGIRYDPGGLVSPRIIYGKWLVGCEFFSNFVVHDLDSIAGPYSHQLLWKSALPIYSWDACSVVSTSGLLIYFVFRTTTDEPWKLLEFRVNGNSLYRTLTLDVPTREDGDPVDLEGGHSPFLYIEGQRLIFDTETRSFYEFPEFKSALVSSDSRPIGLTLWEILLTKTHIICLFRDANCTVSPMVLSTLIQAFTLPADPRPVHNGAGVLRLSHEGVVPGFLQKLYLIRNSMVDAVSGSTSIRLLRQYFEGDNLYFSSVDLALPGNSFTDTVLPMTIDRYDIAYVNHVWFGVYRDHKCYVESSDDGHARGFWRFFVPRDAPMNMHPHHAVMRFTIDASRDKCVAVLGRIRVPQWRQIDDPRQSTCVLFDGVGGRLYHDGLVINIK